VLGPQVRAATDHVRRPDVEEMLRIALSWLRAGW
jgi:hypothetical protein